jgi:hypothetical protein
MKAIQKETTSKVRVSNDTLLTETGLVLKIIE